MMRLQIDHYHHFSAETEARLRRIEHMIDLIIRNQEIIMINTDALVAIARRATKGNADLLAVLTAIRNQNIANAEALAAVQAQLAAIPADTAAAEAAIAAVVTDLTKVAEDTEAAVAANTQVPDMPPA